MSFKTDMVEPLAKVRRQQRDRFGKIPFSLHTFNVSPIKQKWLQGMNTKANINKLETLIDKLEKSESQFDRIKISQTIKFILDDLIEKPKISANRFSDSDGINAHISISEITTSLFVVSNFDVDSQAFSNHIDYLQKNIQNLQFAPALPPKKA